MMAHSIVENVVKQGYLKKGHAYGANRLSGFFRRNDVNKWFVFTIRQGVPYLEYYDSDVDVFTHQPINSFNLSECQNVKSMGNTSPPSFCIVCPDRVIELVASSRTQMVEWVNEVQASLTRLGILQTEVIDHVYTVCPAVIRKPRFNKENSEENNTETVPSQAAAAMSEMMTSSSSSDHTFSPRSPPSRIRASTVKAPSRTALMSRSSFHGSTSSSLDLASPPPLPSRLPSQPFRTNTSQERDLTTENENPNIHPWTESSNDSDFVSPEVIAELRRQRLVANMRTNISAAPVERDPEAVTSPSTRDVQAPILESLYDSGVVPDHCPSPDRNLQLTSTSETSLLSESSSESSTQNVDHFTETALPTSSVPDDNMLMPLNVVENHYSLFPCQQRSSDVETNYVKDSDSSIALITKPTPVPRKVLPRLHSTHFDEPTSVPSEHSISVVSVYTDALTLSESMPNDVSSCDHVEDENPEGEYTTLRTQEPEEDRSSPEKDQGNLGNTTKVSHSEETLIKHSESHESYSMKDENENIYILMSNNCPPPVTQAPPIPSIPPLPPRLDSLQAKSECSKSHISTKTVVTTSDIKSPVSSTSQSSAFSAATSNKHRDLQNDYSTKPTSGKHRDLDNESSGVPPLPLPRRISTNTESHTRVLSGSAFMSSAADIAPPMIPRRAPPPPAINQEDKPPVLPSRNSQSFFIKRPQITGLQSNIKDSAENSWSHNNAALVVDDYPRNTDSKSSESGASVGASSLSKKMLLDHSHNLHTVVSLKHTQADILQSEISKSFVTLSLTQKSGHGLALVDWNNSPCVAGWNLKDFPSLHGKLHLGDLIISINKIRVTSSEAAQKLLKQAPPSEIEVTLRRMPYAKVFAIHRDAEGQSLGIKREGSTGQITYVDPNGLAAQHGLTSHAQRAASENSLQCNWYLTEVNNRPLSLFYKENEIDQRLAAVGREISIVVQPSDFIYEIRRQLKKVKNYKSFIIQ